MTPAEKLSAIPLRRRKIRKPKANAKQYGPWRCRIRELRDELDLSLHRVAEAIDMNAGCLHRIELGGDPMLSTAVKIAVFFGVPVESIWSEK